MKKKTKIIVFTSAICGLLSSCCLTYKDSIYIGDYEVFYSNLEKEGFIARYEWDGTEEKKDITIVDYYKSIKITSVGGYFGRGVPAPFFVNFPDSYGSIESIVGFSSLEEYIERDNVPYVFYDFHISIGANVERIYSYYYGYLFVKDDVKTLYVPRFTVECSAKNRTFYAEDGKLYYKSNNKIDNEFYYVE